jgi:hypothetical protein
MRSGGGRLQHQSIEKKQKMIGFSRPKMINCQTTNCCPTAEDQHEKNLHNFTAPPLFKGFGIAFVFDEDADIVFDDKG